MALYKKARLLFGALLCTAGFATSASAATVTSTLGSVPTGCDLTTGCAPGTDLSGTLTNDFISGDISMTFNYGAIVDNILSVSLSMDIIDADYGSLDLLQGGAGGALLGNIDPSGINSGGTPGPWRVPGDPLDPIGSIVIASTFFLDIADGVFTVFGDSRTLGTWGANMATLTIETDGLVSAVPLPAGLPLLAGGFGLLGLLGYRRKRAA